MNIDKVSRLSRTTAISVRDARVPFYLLDGLRGIAALAVLVYHAHALFSTRQWLPSTYLAVDLFFLLSGFVLAYAYDRRLDEGLGWLRFMTVRLARLYPCYAIALLIASTALAVAMLAGSRVLPSFAALGWSVLFGLLLVPTPSTLSYQDALYATNPAAWSIFWELAVNLLFAVAFRFVRGKTLVALIVFAALALTLLASSEGTIDAGSSWSSATTGLARVLFSFYFGVLLYRVHRFGRLRATAPWWLLMAVMLATFVLRFGDRTEVAYEVACVTVVYPILIFCAANAATSPLLDRLCEWGGSISYPVYILHTPLLFLLTGLMVRATNMSVETLRPWGGVAVVLFIVIVSFGMHRWVERPALRLLRGRIAADSRAKASAPRPTA